MSAPASNRWQWVKSEAASDLAWGKQQIVIASEKYGSCLDSFFLTEDKDFEPTRRVLADKPKALTLEAKVDDGLVRLNWSGKKSKRFYHYNVYVSDKADFVPSQATLLVSPDRETYLDWQIKPDVKNFYKVTQVTRDGLESTPSDAASPQ